ncbi:hypothetical protein F4808DRAFT_442239 [Astrocystis sublimbata]|nr:hypothetical protein F4808DRAFT_442239 [Astrocystis sublimbata]
MAPDLNSLPPSSPIAVPHRAANGSQSSSGGVPGDRDPTGISTSVSVSGSTSAVSGESPSASPRSAAVSLQAAATVNAGLQHEPGRRTSSNSLSRQRHSPQAGRRRSSVLMNLQLNDPTVPAPGEMPASESGATTGQGQGHPPHQLMASPQPLPASPLMTARDPYHNRTPSLGELHQELEAEQEAQVNRLLQMIRQQQIQLLQLQTAQGQGHSQSGVAAEEPNTASSTSTSHAPATVPFPVPPSPSGSTPRSPSLSHPSSTLDTARDALHRRSRTPSHSQSAASPRLAIAPSPLLSSSQVSSLTQGPEGEMLAVRDEMTYYQAETQSLVRENQMLRHRVRELERQLSETQADNTGITREPAHPSHLSSSISVSERSNAPEASSTTAATQTVASSDAKDEI